MQHPFWEIFSGRLAIYVALRHSECMALHHESTTDEPLGKRMERARGFAGISKGAIAIALGVDRKTIYNWETGVTYPPVDKLAHFARVSTQNVKRPPPTPQGEGGRGGGLKGRTRRGVEVRELSLRTQAYAARCHSRESL